MTKFEISVQNGIWWKTFIFDTENPFEENRTNDDSKVIVKELGVTD